MTATIIIPHQTTREVNCIIQDGVRYCENQPLTKEGARGASIVIVVMVLWMLLIGWVAMGLDKPLLAILIFLAPFLLTIFLF